MNKNAVERKSKSFFKIICSLLMILIGGIYILNPTLGVFELIPDNLPFIGNLDEAAAVYLIITGLRYLGLDITKWSKTR